MTTAEISAKLCDWGSIRNPKDTSSLGKLLQSMGYEPYRSGKLGRGYVVYVNQDIDNQRKAHAREAEKINNLNNPSGDSSDSSDSIF